MNFCTLARDPSFEVPIRNKNRRVNDFQAERDSHTLGLAVKLLTRKRLCVEEVGGYFRFIGP